MLYSFYNNPPNKIKLVKKVFELDEQKNDYLCIVYQEYPDVLDMYIGKNDRLET